MARLTPLVLPACTLATATLATKAPISSTHTIAERTIMVDTALLRDLICRSRMAAIKAYAPFSRFHVGAALLMNDDPSGTIITGANVENSSYGLTICAERTAIHYAAAQGFRSLKYIAVSCLSTTAASLHDRSPCGACRQVINEFSSEETLILLDRGTTDYTADILDMERLLPFGFKFSPP